MIISGEALAKRRRNLIYYIFHNVLIYALLVCGTYIYIYIFQIQVYT